MRIKLKIVTVKINFMFFFLLRVASRKKRAERPKCKKKLVFKKGECYTTTIPQVRLPRIYPIRIDGVCPRHYQLLPSWCCNLMR